jgi:hypothetical protein
MKTYIFTGGKFDKTYGVFMQPVSWTEGNGEIEVFISLTETRPSDNHQFVTSAYQFNGDDKQSLLLVTAGGEPSIRANIKAVTLKPGEKVKIKIQPYPNQA